MRKLDRHVERFHGDFDQGEKGKKRKKDDNDRYPIKRTKWGEGESHESDDDDDDDR